MTLQNSLLDTGRPSMDRGPLLSPSSPSHTPVRTKGARTESEAAADMSLREGSTVLPPETEAAETDPALSAYAAALGERTQELMQKSAQLERALERERELAWQLQAALTKEAELSRLKTHIIAVVSHEFRTPLAVINTSAELLLQHQARLPEEKLIDIHRRLKHAVFALTDRLQDVVTVESAGSGKLQHRPAIYTYGDFSRSLVEQLHQEIDNPARIQFHVTGDRNQRIHVDMSLVKQTVYTLLSNAVKYSPDQQRIAAEIRLEDDRIHVEIADNGIGIPVDEQEKIFELFYRGSNADLQSGLGLGLYIAKQATSIMDGSLSIVSAGVDKGATCRLSIPAKVNIQHRTAA